MSAEENEKEQEQKQLADLQEKVAQLEDLIRNYDDKYGDDAPDPIDEPYPIEYMSSTDAPDMDWVAERILARRRRKGTTYYKVKWKGGPDVVSWEREEDLECISLMRDFDESTRSSHTIAREVTLDQFRRTKGSSNSKRTKPRKELKATQEDKPEYDASTFVAPAYIPPPTTRPRGGRGGGARGGGGRGTGRGGRGPPVDSYSPPPTTTYTTTTSTPVDWSSAAGLHTVPDTLDNEKLLKLLEQLEATITENEKHVFSLQHNVNSPPKNDCIPIVQVFNHMIQKFAKTKYFQDYYGYCEGSDAFLADLTPGGDVPEYFANVGGQTIYHRKMLSMAGLRNLILYGTEIFNELKAQLFLGDPCAYPSMKGMSKMKYFTGNTVDLDTPVLRPSDRITLETINTINKHKGDKTYSSADEFGESQQAQEIARAAAAPLIEAFVSDFKLSKQQVKDRRLDIESCGTIPIAGNNRDRGRWPVWQYINVGVNSFHVNVPNMPDVIGALLKAPFHCAWAYLVSLKSEEATRSFYEDGVADSCFNGKWKAIEEYIERFNKCGSINNVLEEIQAANQSVFTIQFFDDDDAENTKEIAMMVSLLKGAVGRDASGKTRLISPEDVIQWVRDPSIAI
eukprot:TRINITY_DN55745_c0_g1_i1.p1 TRINITY_DN55745_c0_g1~~TRINITY_DN55745_c0_g1_i1.p1  ORF type:complete len:623 (-),score=80.60 TRINITY_DN55745_c0_g1_i1:48-1916(-)